MDHPTFAPWNGTLPCASPSNCVVDGVHMSLSMCDKFDIPEKGLVGSFCTCSRFMHLGGVNCNMPDPAYAIDGNIQLMIGLAEVAVLAWMIVRCVQLRSTLKVDILAITMVIAFCGSFFIACHAFGRAMGIKGHTTDIVIAFNRLGSGLAGACLPTALLVIVLSWQRILSSSSANTKELFSKPARMGIACWATVSSILLVVLFFIGKSQVAVLAGLLMTFTLLIWYNLVGKRLIKAFDKSGSGKTNESVRTGVRRIQRLIRNMTIFGSLTILGFVWHIAAAFLSLPHHLSSPWVVTLSVYHIHLAIILCFACINRFVFSVRAAVQKNTQVQPMSTTTTRASN